MELPSVGLPTLGPPLLVLLRFVDGKPIDPLDPVDQLWWGDRLAACQRALSTFTHSGLGPWQTLRAEAVHRPAYSWLGPAVRRAVEAFEKLTVLDRLTFGCLHGDPRPAAFLLDHETGRVGVVGWGHVCIGPLLYDLATAVMYAGGTAQAGDLLDAYSSAGVVPKPEIESALPTLLQLRWAARADYFARRLASESTVDDLQGLAQAREALLG